MISRNLCCLLLSIILFACQQQEKLGPPVIAPEQIEKEFSDWWAYHHYQINLSGNDYIALDEQANTIDKARFLEKLSTGSFIPVQLDMPTAKIYYQLFQLSGEVDPTIVKTISNIALKVLHNYTQEGQDFPKFEFTDLKGNTYTNASIKGKTLVLKTWFIACHACVAEFPELNELVDKNAGRNNLMFISLAQDDPSKLEAFLAKKTFKYATVGNQKDFLAQLKVSEYPTHFIIGPDGKIKKVVNNVKHMIESLKSLEYI